MVFPSGASVSVLIFCNSCKWVPQLSDELRLLCAWSKWSLKTQWHIKARLKYACSGTLQPPISKCVNAFTSLNNRCKSHFRSASIVLFGPKKAALCLLKILFKDTMPHKSQAKLCLLCPTPSIKLLYKRCNWRVNAFMPPLSCIKWSV